MESGKKWRIPKNKVLGGLKGMGQSPRSRSRECNSRRKRERDWQKKSCLLASLPPAHSRKWPWECFCLPSLFVFLSSRGCTGPTGKVFPCVAKRKRKQNKGHVTPPVPALALQPASQLLVASKNGMAKQVRDSILEKKERKKKTTMTNGKQSTG